MSMCVRMNACECWFVWVVDECVCVCTSVHPDGGWAAGLAAEELTGSSRACLALPSSSTFQIFRRNSSHFYLFFPFPFPSSTPVFSNSAPAACLRAGPGAEKTGWPWVLSWWLCLLAGGGQLGREAILVQQGKLVPGLSGGCYRGGMCSLLWEEKGASQGRSATQLLIGSRSGWASLKCSGLIEPMRSSQHGPGCAARRQPPPPSELPSCRTQPAPQPWRPCGDLGKWFSSSTLFFLALRPVHLITCVHLLCVLHSVALSLYIHVLLSCTEACTLGTLSPFSCRAWNRGHNVLFLCSDNNRIDTDFTDSEANRFEFKS